MAYNQRLNIPPYGQSGTVPYVLSGQGAVTQDTIAQMTQLSLSAGQQTIISTPSSFQGSSLGVPANINLTEAQRPTSIPVQQNMAPGRQIIQPPVSIDPYLSGHVNVGASISPTTPEALQEMYRMAPVPHDLNPAIIGQPAFHNPAALSNQPSNSHTAPLYLHGVQLSPHHSSPHQILQQQQQQIFGYDEHNVQMQQQPFQNISLSSPTNGSIDQIQQSPNVPRTMVNVQNTRSNDLQEQLLNLQPGKTQLNALPHSMPTVLNSSLQRKRSSDIVSPQSESGYISGDSNPGGRRDSNELYSPRGGTLHQQMDQNAGLEVNSSSRWREEAIPVYQIPANKDICLRCVKKVYAMERVGPLKDAIYHKNCFTCAVCKTKLTMKNFHHNPSDMGDVNVYCSSHKPKTKNIGSEASAYYINQDSKEPPLVKFETSKASQPFLSNKRMEHKSAVTNSISSSTPAPQLPAVIVADMPSNINATPERSEETEVNAMSPVVMQVGSPLTPEFRRYSAASTGGSSPLSSLSSSSSFAFGAQPDSVPLVNQPDGGASMIRSDRPSSTSSLTTTISMDDLSKPETVTIRFNDSGDNVNHPDSNDPIVRGHRPSSITKSEIKSKPGTTVPQGQNGGSYTHSEANLIPPDASLVRHDRPSSLSSSITLLESEPKTKSPKAQNGDPKKVPLITSDILERRDRPSSIYQQPSNVSESKIHRRDPSSRMIKSHSAHAFPTGNELANENELTTNRKRSDRPSQ